MKRVFLAAAVIMLAVYASGCTNNTNSGINETTEYEYYNTTTLIYNESGNASANYSEKTAEKDFTFKINGDGEFWLKANDTMAFDVVFNNFAEDGEDHMYVARIFPSAANFDAMAAFKCMHFTTCDTLISHMNSMIGQPEKQVTISYGYIDLYTITIHVPNNTPKGKYMYNAVACKDLGFSECTETSCNFGPNVPVTVHVI